jgi:hypothetical protein
MGCTRSDEAVRLLRRYGGGHRDASMEVRAPAGGEPLYRHQLSSPGAHGPLSHTWVAKRWDAPAEISPSPSPSPAAANSSHACLLFARRVRLRASQPQSQPPRRGRLQLARAAYACARRPVAAPHHASAAGCSGAGSVANPPRPSTLPLPLVRARQAQPCPGPRRAPARPTRRPVAPSPVPRHAQRRAAPLHALLSQPGLRTQASAWPRGLVLPGQSPAPSSV